MIQAKEPGFDAEYLGEWEVKCWGPGIRWGSKGRDASEKE